MLRLAAKGQPLRVVSDQSASPAYPPALAARTAELVERDASGIFHIGGGASVSWFEWAGKIFRAAGLNPPLSPTTEREFQLPARRPKDSGLSNAKAEALGITPMPPLDDAIRAYMEARVKRLAARS
jgi:dTDP-4-dehydrorhamnose reductase